MEASGSIPLAPTIRNLIAVRGTPDLVPVSRPRSSTDRACAYGALRCRFESCRGCVNEIPEGTKCAQCDHPATIQVADSALDIVHGFYSRLCNCCVLRKWMAHYREVAQRMEHWKTQEGKPCPEIQPVAPDPVDPE